jgi:prevent-host-death family protein
MPDEDVLAPPGRPAKGHVPEEDRLPDSALALLPGAGHRGARAPHRRHGPGLQPQGAEPYVSEPLALDTDSDVDVTEGPGSTGADEIELTVSEARDQLADLVNRVAYGGETVFLTRRGRRMVVLGPVAEPEA